MKIFLYIVAVLCFITALCGLLISSYGMLIIFLALGAYMVYGAKNWGKIKAKAPAPVQAPKREPVKEATKTQNTTKAKNIEIKENWISAIVGKTGDIDCNIICRSENGKYYFGDGTYCASENSDLVDCIFLFTENELLYRKAFDTGIETAFLLDNGTVIMYDDMEVLHIYDAAGKQITKKKLGISADKVDINSERAVIFGMTEDCVQQLALLKCADYKLIVNDIPDINYLDDEGEEDTIYGSEADLHIVPEGFIIIYSNNDYIFIDTEGNKTLLPEEMTEEIKNILGM